MTKPPKPELAIHPAADTEDPVRKLTQVLELAKKGELTDFVMVYMRRSDPEPWIKHSYSQRSRMKIIGAIEIMKVWLANAFQFEVETDPTVDPEESK